MTTTEHLQRIRARCVELLAIAEKRTEEKWIARYDSVIDKSGVYVAACFHNNSGWNGAFIASCAGPAEAGWRATIAAIDGLMHDYKLRRRFEVDPDVLTYKPLMDIIAAWPEELL